MEIDETAKERWERRARGCSLYINGKMPKMPPNLRRPWITPITPDLSKLDKPPNMIQFMNGFNFGIPAPEPTIRIAEPPMTLKEQIELLDEIRETVKTWLVAEHFDFERKSHLRKALIALNKVKIIYSLIEFSRNWGKDDTA